MRYIEINSEPSDDWIQRANAVTERLLELGYCEECLRIIDRNETLWRELKDWLGEQSHGKCWYSESKDNASYWQVDHCRPKTDVKDLNGNRYNGYWWLAFNWRNYRLAGGAINSPKSSKFPIRPGTTYANSPNDDVNDETPYLLDPRKPEDPGLLSFDNRGEALPSQEAGWYKERAQVSIEILNLNGYEQLVRARRTLWQNCELHVNRALNLFSELDAHQSVTRQTEFRNEIMRLREMVRKESEFSAVACICIRSAGRNWLNNAILNQ
jgi:hypothetical protein